MPRYLLDTIQVQATAPTAVLGTVATVTADSLQVKDAEQTLLLPAFSHHQVAGVLEISSNAMHDGVNGITGRAAAAVVEPMWPLVMPLQPIARVDTLRVRFTGSAVGGQIETGVLPVVYVNPASQNNANLLTFQDLKSRGSGQIATVVSTHTGGATGGYSGALALNAAANTYNLKGGKNYALVGIEVDTVCAAVTLRGPGTGNTRVAIPGNATQKHQGLNYLKNLSVFTGLPTFPVVSAVDAGSTTLEVVCNQAGGTFIVNWHFMLLNS